MQLPCLGHATSSPNMLSLGLHLKQSQEEFSRKRSKGKLPDDATLLLKRWWDAHLEWPYPSVSEISKDA